MIILSIIRIRSFLFLKLWRLYLTLIFFVSLLSQFNLKLTKVLLQNRWKYVYLLIDHTFNFLYFVLIYIHTCKANFSTLKFYYNCYNFYLHLFLFMNLSPILFTFLWVDYLLYSLCMYCFNVDTWLDKISLFIFS